MKQTYLHSFATFLFFLGTLLFCLSSCQSSDDTEVGEGARVADLPLKAQIENNTSSRVGMADSYGGAFSSYWNSDRLNIYDRYVLNGTVQSMAPLEFATSATSGTSATFSYTGGAYRYNPGSRLYAFSKNTSGGYAANVNADGTSTLTASTLSAQLGTLTDCAKYDALYGSAIVDFNTGLPGSLTMYHLFGMLNLHLTSSTFLTGSPVTVALTSSNSNILPGNGGSATLGADGTTITRTGSWGTSWSKSITPTAPGAVDVYLMTWPFSSISGNFTVSCSDGNYNTYVARTVSLNSFSLAAAQLKSKPLAITNIPPSSTYSKLYAWDATNSVPVTVGTVPTNANTTTVATSSTDYSKRALYACAGCPSGYAITWYLKAGCYWDNGSINGGNMKYYKMADGSYTKAGMWFKKSSNITGFSGNTSSGTTTCAPTPLSTKSAAEIAALNLSTDYFFLPAAGFTSFANGAFSSGGTIGLYWSSAPNSTTSVAHSLRFDSTVAFLNTGAVRSNGFCRWSLQ